MSVAELAQRTGRSVSQLVELVLGGRTISAAADSRPKATASAPKKKPGPKPKAKATATEAKATPAKPATPATPAKPAKGAKPAKAAKAAKPAAEPKAKGGAKEGVDTRDRDGRQHYETLVLDAIRAAKGRIKAVDLRSRLGGSPLQARAALHRLIASGKVKRHGKARGTSYTSA